MKTILELIKKYTEERNYLIVLNNSNSFNDIKNQIELYNMFIADLQQLNNTENKYFKNKFFTKRNYEYTDIVFCESKENPDENKWELSSEEELIKMQCTQLYIDKNNVKYYGYL